MKKNNILIIIAIGCIAISLICFILLIISSKNNTKEKEDKVKVVEEKRYTSKEEILEEIKKTDPNAHSINSIEECVQFLSDKYHYIYCPGDKEITKIQLP